MMPVLFTWGDISVRSYLVFTLVAISAAVILIRYYEIPYLKARGQCPPNIFKYNGEALLLAIIFTIIGARLGYVITNWSLYSANPINILALWRGGFAFHGALIASLPAAALHAYYRRMPLGKLLDLSIPYIVLAYGIGRLGCFLNGCCYGQVTALPWGMVYPAVDSFVRHPTQLYAFSAALIIFLVLLNINRKNISRYVTPGGLTFAWFLILHGSYRFMVEFFRVSEDLIGPVTPAQVVSFVLILGGTVFLWIWKNRIGGDIHD